MFLKKLGRDEYKFNIKIGETEICIPLQITLVVIGGLLLLGYIKAFSRIA